MGTAQDGQATAVLIDEVFGGAGADTALNRAELSAAYTHFGIILRRVSRLFQPCTAPHAPCGVRFLVAMCVEC